MNKNTKVLKFLMTYEINSENINEYLNVTEKTIDDALKAGFKCLNKLIYELSFGIDLEDLELLEKNIDFISSLCDMNVFSHDDILFYKKRIKKTRETLLLHANKHECDELIYLANKIDEIVLDKNFKVEDLISLIKELIDRKEDPNIIKKFLNINKEVVIHDILLFNYVFDKTIDALKTESNDIYYYITLLKLFYNSRIKKFNYLRRLDEVDNSIFVEEIRKLLHGVKRSLTPDEILEKYQIITDLPKSSIILPSIITTTSDDILTIDDSYTNLRDDGLSIKKDGTNYIVKVNIADVANFIKPDTAENFYAKVNLRNFHIGNGASMLASDLRKKLSLDQGQKRKVVTMCVVMNDSGDIIDYYMELNDVYVARNISYDHCDRFIGKTNNQFNKDLTDLYYLACALEERSKSKQVYWSKKEKSRADFTISNTKGFKIIREFMVLYNMLLGQLANEYSFPYVYRYQDPEYISNLIRKKGISENDQIRNVINSIYLDSRFSPTPRYHAGIKTDIYTQSTDPLRKYPDLYNQQLLHNFYFKDYGFDFDYDEFLANIDYFNSRNRDLALMKAEYSRGMRLTKNN